MILFFSTDRLSLSKFLAKYMYYAYIFSGYKGELFRVVFYYKLVFQSMQPVSAMIFSFHQFYNFHILMNGINRR